MVDLLVIFCSNAVAKVVLILSQGVDNFKTMLMLRF